MDGLEVVAVPAPGPDVVREIDALLGRVTRATGHPALGENKLLEPARTGPGGGRSPTGASATALLARHPGRDGLAGYAQVTRGRRPGEYATELALHPGADGDVADALLDAAVAAVVARGGGILRWWVAKPTRSDDERASARGMTVERDLVQMRCGLPVDPDVRASAVEVHTRPFRPSVDEEAWLVSNNRAFATHPEQGQWELATILEREHEPWFDPDGFLVLEEDGHMAGSCWTKIHADTDPPLGEIYVIGIDPAFQGRGFGRALALAGLDWLNRAGLSVGMLYVDAANSVARTLYRSIGFSDDHVDRAYLGRFDPS